MTKENQTNRNLAEQMTDQVMENYPMVKVEDEIDNFDLEVYQPGQDEIVEKQINDYKGNWLVLFFYPADYTFVCPTELKELNDKRKKFEEMENVDVLVASTDSSFVHKNWVEKEPLLEDFKLPMISDRKTVLSRYFGILNDETGHSERATFVINPDGVLKAMEVSTEPVGRNPDELIRKLKALKHVRQNEGEACPSNWDESCPSLTPGVDISGDVGNNLG